MKGSLVSVIIPTYNRASTIERSVRSVLNQTHTNLECIVVDDCSTDDTKLILEGIKDDRLKYFSLEKNSGACTARNKGIELAQGEYIAFQDSDDEFRPNKLELQLRTLLEQNADVVFCAMQRHGYSKKTSIFPNVAEGFKSHREIVTGFFISTQTIFGKKSVFDKFTFDATIPRLQDYDLMVRIAREYQVYFLPEVLVDVYLQGDSITNAKNHYQKMLDITDILLEKYAKYRTEYPEWDLIMLNRKAFALTMMGSNATELYKEIYSREKSKSNYFKCVLSKLKLLKCYYKIRKIS